MRKILFLLFILPTLAWSQSVPKEFQKMNTMVIQSDEPDFINVIASRLLDDGWMIDDLDEKLGTIRTLPRAVASVQWQIRVRVKDNKAEFQNHTSMELTLYGVTSSGWTLTNFKSPPGSYGKISDGLYILVSSINPEIEYFKK